MSKTCAEAFLLLTAHVTNGWGGFCDLYAEGDNKLSLATRTSPYAQIWIKMPLIEQVALMGRTPPKRVRGTVEINYGWPWTHGGSFRAGFVDKIASLLTSRAVDEIELGDGHLLSVVEGKDWNSQLAVVPFNFELTT